jgi:RND family efflux transporter MFP subunit
LRVVHIVILGAIASAVGCSASSQADSNRQPQAVSITTSSVPRISIQRQVELAGTLTSPDQAKVSSEVAAIVREIPVELGTRVRRGDVLVRLDQKELTLAVERAESALRQVEAQLGLDRSKDRQPPPDDQIATVQQAAANRDDARAAFKRAEQLNSRGLLAQVDRDTAETRMKVAEAAYLSALDNVHSLRAALQDRRAAYDLAQKKLNDTIIRSPVDGAIAERLIQPGEYIRENTPVVTIVQINPLKLKTAVQERYAGAIKAGQGVQFTVEAFPGRTFEGKVAYVGPAIDQATRTFPIEALIENPTGDLKPGFFAKAAVATKLDSEVIAVPEDAVSQLAGVSSVFVVEGGKVRQQNITLGARKDQMFEVVEGLKGTETLATSNLSQLATGTAVQAEGDRP